VACLAVVAGLAGCTCAPSHPRDGVTVETLLREMVDLEALARRPEPFFTEATASSYDRESGVDGGSWFANGDHGQFVRTERNGGREEHVLADLRGPGTTTRFWIADPTDQWATEPQPSDVLRFYFDGEPSPRVQCTVRDLFTGKVTPISPPFAYSVGGGGDVYFPLPYARALKITHEQRGARPASELYYQIGYRTYEGGTRVDTYDPEGARSWRAALAEVGDALTHPSGGASWLSDWVSLRSTVGPGETASLPEIEGPKTVFEWSARVLDTREGAAWDDPARAHNAYRFLLLELDFDGEKSIRVPLGDFFGSGPGINPYEDLAFTVEANGRMTSRLRMPFRRSMALRLVNAGTVPYTIDVRVHVGKHEFTPRDWHLRAEWRVLTRASQPPFDMPFLATTGEGKLVGSVYDIANPVLVWWGEGDQKIYIDGETFPSTFGTGTEDDYGIAFARGDIFARPFHAQTRMDGPKNGGHVSLTRLFVLDALPFRRQIRFDQEVWHWMPCRPTWSHVVYWYAAPGSPGPTDIDRSTLAPVDLGRPADKIAIEGESLAREVTGGEATVEAMGTWPEAEHLVWRDGKPGDRMTMHFAVPAAGRYEIVLSLMQFPAAGRQRFLVDGHAAEATVDGYSSDRLWQLPTLGVFDLVEGDHTLEAEALEPNARAEPGNVLALDYLVIGRR
jgi:hypothetical protein